MAKPKYNIKMNLTLKQKEAWDLCDSPKIDYLLFGGGAGGGKSYLFCMKLIILCLLYPDTRYFIGREELKRITMTTLRTFFKVCKDWGLPVGKGKLINYNAQKNVIYFSNGSLIDLLELKHLPSDPLFERFGSSEYTKGWIEEAGEVHFLAFDILKTRVGRHNNDKYGLKGQIYLTCNPKKNWLYTQFYKPSVNGTLPDNMAFIQSLIQDNYLADSTAEENLRNITNKAQKQRLYYGNWEYADAPDQLISYDLIYEAIGRVFDADYEPTLIHTLGVDVARMGDDSTILVDIDNDTLTGMHKFDKLRTDEVADKVLERKQLRALSEEDITVDADGLGSGTVDSLFRRGCYVNELHSASKPTAAPVGDAQLPYANMRTQLYFEFRDRLLDKRFSISRELEGSEDLELLLDDLTSVKYKIVNDKYIALEKKDDIKKRIGRSPDRGDGVIYATFQDGNSGFFCEAI